MDTTTLTDNKKLLAIHLVIQIIIKPSNKYYRNAITKIQRFWRKRSGYYGYKPMAECKIVNIFNKNNRFNLPPRLKRSMNCCSGRCLSQQQKKRYKLIIDAHTLFEKDIAKIFKNRTNQLCNKIPHPVMCVCNNYENFHTLEGLWRHKNYDHLILTHTPETRRKLSRFNRNKIYQILAQDKINWVTRNQIINFLKFKNIIS
jgi:hypothetical protein